MDKYAIFQKGSKQYKVTEGEELLIDKLPTEDAIEFDQVVLVADGDKVSIGQPFVKGAKIQASFVKAERGEKIRVFKYKSKSRYRKAKGHKSQLSRVKVEKIVS